MGKEKILIVEDESAIQELISYNLQKNGFIALSSAYDGESALEMAERIHPDLILLDLMLPGMDGLEVCRRLKKSEKLSSIPIIMLTAKSEESDIVVGLELGAEDYITKPFSTKILVARVRTCLRRNSAEVRNEISAAELRRGVLVINSATRSAVLDGEELSLTCSEFDLLYLLARKEGWVFTRSRIVNEIKGSDYPVTDRSIDVQIVGLRRKLGRYSAMIETIRGVGYRFNQNEVA